MIPGKIQEQTENWEDKEWAKDACGLPAWHLLSGDHSTFGDHRGIDHGIPRFVTSPLLVERA